MRRTTVALREDQLVALRATAKRLGRTEADLLSEAVDLVLARYGTPMGAGEMPTADPRRSTGQAVR